MKLLFAIAVFIITLSVVSSEFRYYVDRTADIVVEPKELSKSSMFLKGHVFNKAELSSLKDIQISSLISHVMGTLPLNSQDRTGFPHVSLFNKPKLNLFFALDSVSKDDLKMFNFLNQESSIQIEKSFYPMDSVSELTTIFSGVRPSAHGIVGQSWENQNGKKVDSYKNGVFSLSANLADVASQTFGGKSIIISSSSSRPMAASMGVHPNAHSVSPSGLHQTLYNTRLTMESLYMGKGSLILNSRDIENLLYSREFRSFILPSGWNAVLASGMLTITNEKGDSVTVDIDDNQIVNLFSELAAAYTTVKELASKESIYADAVSDAIPDFVSFAFSAISGIEQDSEFYQFAAKMVDSCMSSTYQQLSGLYGNRIACEVVALNGGDDLPEQVVGQIASATMNHGSTNDHASNPSSAIYLRPSSKSQRQSICDSVQNSVGQDYTVHCVNQHTFVHASVVGANSSSSDSPTYTNATMAASAQVAAFQIFLFFPIVWVIFIAGGLILTMGISFDAQKDTLLYRSAGRASSNKAN